MQTYFRKKWSISIILGDIVSLIAEFELIRFRWITPGKNKDADALAKQALLLETIVMNSSLGIFKV